MAQDRLMLFDPETGKERPHPSHAAQWRDFHGPRTAWLFNPWTGSRRSAPDVGADTFGFGIFDGPFTPAKCVMAPSLLGVPPRGAT